MTTQVLPQVYHLAGTQIAIGLDEFLNSIGAVDWESDTLDDAALLIEVAGRACYRSFGVGLNANVTRVRDGNANYLLNSILNQKHGSVLEHATDTFALTNVSRIVTHELVRHRQGTAFSQESGRFIRVDDIHYYMPEALKDDAFLTSVYNELDRPNPGEDDYQSWKDDIRRQFTAGMQTSELFVQDLEELVGLDQLKDFGKKKKLQSAIRRLAPNGMANTIIVTANHRAWRHICSVRTSGGAEEEIRLVQWLIFEHLRDLHPNIYQDAIVTMDEFSLPSGVPVVSFTNEKV